MRKDKVTPINDYNKMVPAVEQAAKIIVYLSSKPGLQSNLTEISKSIGISKSKAYAILNTLQRFSFVTRNPDTKAYSLGLYMMTIGQKVMENINYKELARPFLKELARKTDSTSMLGLIAGDSRFIIVDQKSTWEIHLFAQSDKTYPLTYGAHGKAIVAFLEKEERKKILSGKELYFHKHPSLLNRDLLLKELEEECHYWRVSAWDGTEYGEASMVYDFTIDITPPSAVTLLDAESGEAVGDIELSWTSPEGSASLYIIKYATFSIDLFSS